MAVSKEKLYTREEFERFINLPENAERLFELINGEIIEKVPKQLHALIAALLASAFVVYFRSHPIGWVFVEAQVKLPDSGPNDPIPDVSVALKQGRTLDADESLPYMPDLVVEIQSPGQSDKFMLDKATGYFERGAHMVWIVYPSKRIVEMLTLEDRKLLTDKDTIENIGFLPGFTLVVKDIFPD